MLKAFELTGNWRTAGLAAIAVSLLGGASGCTRIEITAADGPNRVYGTRYAPFAVPTPVACNVEAGRLHMTCWELTAFYDFTPGPHDDPSARSSGDGKGDKEPATPICKFDEDCAKGEKCSAGRCK